MGSRIELESMVMRNGSTRRGIPSRPTLIALLVALLFVAGAVYKWVDEQGKLH